MNNIIKPKAVDFENVPTTHVTKTGKKTPDFYKGTSFRWCREWEPGRSYVNDEYFVDIVYHQGRSWVCVNSHISSGENHPSENSSFWELSVNQSGSGIHVGPEPPTPEEYGDLYDKMLWLDTSVEEDSLKVYSAGEVDLKLEDLDSKCTNRWTELSNVKADKAITLAGYGITDAYTKTEVNGIKSDLEAYADQAETDAVAESKIYVDGLKIAKTYATKTEVSNLTDIVNLKSDKNDTYTKNDIDLKEDELNSKIEDKLGKDETAANALKLNGQNPSYYATKQSVNSLEEIVNKKADSEDVDTKSEVDKKIQNAFNKFATDISTDGVVNTYKELIDYASEHSSEFVELVGELSEAQNDITDLKKNKIDKVEGKGLSTNDFTDKYKQKVDEFIIDTGLSPTSDNAIANSAVVHGLAGLAEGVSTAIGQVSELFNAELEKKADKEGYYPAMSVGMADNLVGRGDVQDAHINFRPSAGADNITDGAARIKRIKGNSVVWNQLIGAGTIESYPNILNQDGNFYTLELTASTTMPTMKFRQNVLLLNGHKVLVSYGLSLVSEQEFVDEFYAGYVADPTQWFPKLTAVQINSLKSKPMQINSILTLNSAKTTIALGLYETLYQQTKVPFAKGDKVIVSNPQIIDLTKMFGAGNEPTTVEEYHQRKPMNIEDEYAYNAGTLVDMHANKLVSTGDNAYDYTKYYARVMGGYKYDITANAGATLEVSFYADGEDDNEEREIAPDNEGKYTFPANGICYVNGAASHSDVCVCLNHSYDKPHPAYQQVVKDLSFIGEAFPEGMRSAGSAFDEIRFNPTTKKWEAVMRIGVAKNLTFISGGNSLFAVSIADSKWAETVEKRTKTIFSNKYAVSKNVSTGSMGDKSMLQLPQKNNIYIKDSAYATVAAFNEANKDLVIYYELAEPIVVKLDYPTAETNMDYMAWDFGTEEAKATIDNGSSIGEESFPSAPFRAEINYEPNAVDDLRWAIGEIRNLKAQLAQMSASVTNLTE